MNLRDWNKFTIMLILFLALFAFTIQNTFKRSIEYELEDINDELIEIRTSLDKMDDQSYENQRDLINQLYKIESDVDIANLKADYIFNYMLNH